MLLQLWKNLQAAEDALADPNAYRMYSTVVTEGAKFTSIPPDVSSNTNQTILDIDQVRILSMSHKYNPARIHAGLLIYSVDGQTDFILNDIMLRIKTGDTLIHQIPNALIGQEDVYRDLIRTLFGTHRINLLGFVFTFSGNGQFSDCMRWGPSTPSHTTPIHPTEQKLLEILLVSLYMNDAWLTMPMAVHVDLEKLSQSTKKLYLMKLGEIEQLFHKQRKDRTRQNYFPLSNLLKSSSKNSSDNFQSFQWTANRQQTFDYAIERLLNDFYTHINTIFQDGEFDPDQYAYFNDNAAAAAVPTSPVNPYERLQITSPQNYQAYQQNLLLSNRYR